jgi:phosphatidylinositol alpha-1,6-mannosyltransferase
VPRGQRRPKVLVLTPDFPPTRGGVQLLLQRVIANWTRLEPTVITLGKQVTARDPDARVPVIRVRRRNKSHRCDVARLNAEALRASLSIRPDVVLSGHIVMAPAAMAIRRLWGVPFVQYLYGSEVAARPRLTSLAIANATAVIAVSAFTAQLAASIRSDVRVSVIRPGVDVPNDRASPLSDRNSSGIITVARLADLYKGHDVMLRALPLVRARVPDVRWIIVGDGPLRPHYECMAAALRISESVAFRGEASDEERDQLLDTAQVFAMVSRLSAGGLGEGFGIVYLEAGAHALPVVAGRVGGAVDAVSHGENGLLVDPTDHVAVADSLIQLLSDAALARRMGEAGRRRAEATAWPHVSQRVEELILHAAGGGRRHARRWRLRG